MSEYYNKDIECATRETMHAIQSEKLKDMVKRCYENVPFYKDKLDKMGISPLDIKSVDDLSKLPFTIKQDFRDNYPFGLFAVPTNQLVRVHASSGTTGKQTVVGYTENDIKSWADDIARSLKAAGAGADDFVHIAYGYGLFTGGLGVHYGVEKLGATAIPMSSGNTKRQLDVMEDFGSTILCCTPSYALFLAEAMEERGIDPKALPLRAGIFGAEPWTEEMRMEIEQRLDIKAYDIYGLSEIMGPGVASGCSAQNGMHINEDKYLPEVIDPDTGEVLPLGQQGELVFTCIDKEALPLFRYRTSDIVTIFREKCSCGRTLIKMTKLSGRTDDMLIIRGVNVFPSQVESVLLSLDIATPNYLLIVTRHNNMDMLEVQVEMTSEMFSDTVREITEAEQKIKTALLSTLGLSSKVTLVAPKSIKRSEGKAIRVLDKRDS